jgi:predicted patatin/cPLA2 family phospholipase
MAGSKADGFTVALVIEGGSMRGVVAGGMISALQALGLSHAFDVVVGTSAGAIAASYLLANQADLGTRIYYEDLTDRRWIDLRRPARGKPVLDFDYIFDGIVRGVKKLDAPAILASGSRLLIMATRKSDWSCVAIEPATPQDVILALEASSRIPIAGGRAVTIDGEQYLDGSITVSIPFHIAADLAPTHVLVLLTHPSGESAKPMAGLTRRTVPRILDGIHPGLGTAHALRGERYRRELSAVHRAQSDQVMIVRPGPGDPPIRLLEQDAHRLFAGARAGARAFFDTFGYPATDEDLTRLLRGRGPGRLADPVRLP